jgi:hypothetical protein
MIRHLERRLQRRLQCTDRLRRGLIDLLGLGIAYSLVIVLLGFVGVAPGMPSWLSIPTADYFIWEPLFSAPVIFFGGLLAAAVLQLLARSRGGNGTFEDTVAVIGPATVLPTLCTLIPDTIIGLGLLLGWIDPRQWMTDIVRPSLTLGLVWVYLLAYLAGFLVTYPLVARVVHGLHGGTARRCGWLAFIVYQGLLIVFIR